MKGTKRIMQGHLRGARGMRCPPHLPEQRIKMPCTRQVPPARARGGAGRWPTSSARLCLRHPGHVLTRARSRCMSVHVLIHVPTLPSYLPPHPRLSARAPQPTPAQGTSRRSLSFFMPLSRHLRRRQAWHCLRVFWVISQAPFRKGHLSRVLRFMALL